MLAMHAICRREGNRPRNLRDIDTQRGHYGSGWWMLKPEEADSLVGGWLYLHETSSRESHFVARIDAIGERKDDGAIELIVTKQRVPNQRWRGRKAGQAKTEYFRLVPADYAHETGRDFR
jgi:hypothetical protein